MNDFSGISLPFGLVEMFSGISGLLAMVGPYVLIGLAVAFAPQIIDLVKIALFSYKVGKHHGSFQTGVDEFKAHTKYKYSKKYRDGY